LIAFTLSVLLMKWLLPTFNSVAGKHLQLANLADWQLAILLTSALLGMVLLSGLYPAVLLSRFKAVDVLYGRQKPVGQNLFGKGLITLQFSLAVFLLVACMVYYKILYEQKILVTILLISSGRNCTAIVTIKP
jgi:putative ABC transport system permease protein